jgi:hypothetical protein
LAQIVLWALLIDSLPTQVVNICFLDYSFFSVDQTTSCDSFKGSAFGKATAVQGQYLFQLGRIVIVVLLAFSMFCMQVDEPQVQGQGLFTAPDTILMRTQFPASSFCESWLGLFLSNAELKVGQMFWTKKLLVVLTQSKRLSSVLIHTVFASQERFFEDLIRYLRTGINVIVCSGKLTGVTFWFAWNIF